MYAVTFRTLTLIEEGNPKFLDADNNVICFSRITMYADCINSLHLNDPNRLAYSFEQNIVIEQWLRQMMPLNDEQLYDVSLKHEPKRNQLQSPPVPDFKDNVKEKNIKSEIAEGELKLDISNLDDLSKKQTSDGNPPLLRSNSHSSTSKRVRSMKRRSTSLLSKLILHNNETK